MLLSKTAGLSKIFRLSRPSAALIFHQLGVDEEGAKIRHIMPELKIDKPITDTQFSQISMGLKCTATLSFKYVLPCISLPVPISHKSIGLASFCTRFYL